MIGVNDALARVLAHAQPLPAVETPLLDALGLVLAEEIIAAADIPPFRNAAMDGFAVRANDLAPRPPTTLAVVADIAAGHPRDVVIGPGQAARIMTGAAMPAGADTVVRFEETDARDARPGQREPTVQIRAAVSSGLNVRHPGEDVRAGEAVLAAGTPLRPAEIGLLASLGRGSVRVHRRPRVAILATGDELVGIDTEPGPGQIRDSNSYSLAALVRLYGGEPVMLGIIRDHLDELRQVLTTVGAYDVVISSAGVSAGDYDVVKQALREEGRIDLWQVQMKPGRPLAFGWIGDVPYLGLPGNPVAAIVSFEIFARPLLLQLLGHTALEQPRLRARSLDRLDNGSARRHFVRVRVEADDDGAHVCRIAGDQGAGVLTSLVRANGLAVVPEGVTSIEPGEPVEVLRLDWR